MPARDTDGAKDHYRQAASSLVEQMSEAERLSCLDGDRPFWAGLDYLARGGYHWTPFPAAAVERLGFRGFAFSDGPRGVVVGRASCFPVTMARGATWDRDLEERIGEAIGKELRATRADLYGGVCVNLLRHPGWGRAQETYGEDPHHVGEMGAALTRGIQRHAMACVKHFACNSIENSRFKVDVDVAEVPLHEIFLRQFKRIVDEGVASVMSAYNSVNGDWCGESRALLTEILRGEWGFDGFVISDWIFGLRDAARSVTAGLDVEMPHRMIRAAHLRGAIDTGSVDWSEVDLAATRVVATCLRFADMLAGSGEVTGDVIVCEEHVALAREAAARSVVLLKNDTVRGEPALPLDPSKLKKIALIGRLASIVNLGDGGSSEVWPPYVVTIRDGIASAISEAGGSAGGPARDLTLIVCDGAGESGWVQDVHGDGPAAREPRRQVDPTAAAEAARGADAAVVVVGYTLADEGEFMDMREMGDLLALFPGADDEQEAERFKGRMAVMPQVEAPANVKARMAEGGFATGGDRRSLRLHDDDVALIRAVSRANTRTIVVIVSGAAVLISEWDGSVPAIALAWYGGMEGGNGLADVLFGRTEPSGRLPFTIPASEEGLPEFDPDASKVVYDEWHGWWRAERDGRRPPYPFGFGLGYTTFQIEAASATVSVEDPETGAGSVSVKVRVSNPGDRAGSDVVQIYARREGARRRSRLVGFARVELPPEESVESRIEIDLEEFSERDVEAHQMVVVPGTYRIRIARDAADPGITTSVRLPGGKISARAAL